MKWSAMLLAGLLLWPAGAAAQEETDEEFENRVDPTHVFQPVNRTKYSSNMSMMAVVKRNGTTLGEISENTIVAVFSGDEIRGKDIIYADQDDMAFVTIYGEGTETLTLKVYREGSVYDCGGSETFAADGFIGAIDTPYELDISPVSLADNADNTKTLTTWSTKTRDVVLTDRILYKDGKWNTLCLPFGVIDGDTTDDITFSGTPLQGATVMELDTDGTYSGHQTGFDPADGTLHLYFKTATAIEAGRPYIVKWDSGENIESPVFSGVTVSSADAVTVATAYTDADALRNVSFIGTYSPVALTPGDKSNLFLGDQNTLNWPSAANNTDGQYYVNACRAYFYVNLGDPANAVRAIVLSLGEENEATGITTINKESGSRGAATDWYTLDGQKLSQKPNTKGLYINHGRKVAIK